MRKRDSSVSVRWRRVPLAAALIASLALALLLLLFPAPGGATTVAQTVYRGPSDRPYIALTFDDNFGIETALRVLQVLRDREVPATCFVTAQYVNGMPGITWALAEGGFEIADHTRSHPDLTKLSWDNLLREIGGGTDAFRSMTGVWTAPLLRPPYGATSSTVAAGAAARGFAYVVNWDIDTLDWTGRGAADITRVVLSQAHNGAIVLMHLSAPHTWEALPGIIDGLHARGYELVTVSKLLKGDRRFLDVFDFTSGYDAILRFVGAGYMSGYNENWFGPYDSITRGQLAKVATLVAGLHTQEVEQVDSPTFIDLPPSLDSSGNYASFPFDFVEEAVRAGLINGSTDEYGRPVFNTYQSLTRLQLAQIVARMARNLKGYSAEQNEPLPFDDVPDHGSSDASLVSKLGLMNGYEDGSFRPYEPSQRAHVALVLGRYLDLPAYSGPAPQFQAPAEATAPQATTASEDATAPPEYVE